MPDAHRAHTALTERLVTLRDRVAQIETELCQPLDHDLGEQVSDRETDEALGALDRAALTEIAEIEAALQRMKLGVYGICTSCGKAIVPERLEALPATPQCVACAEAQHRR
ncbi:MAG: TraR/DksA C4-type zinc finger protein [Pseudomonadota bacterium]